MRAVLLILVGFVVGYQLGKAAQRRAESSYEMGSDADAGRGRKLAGLAAAASMSAMHRVRSTSSARS
jgi:hypothetical protein